MLNVTARQDLMSKIIETLGVVVEDARFDFSENGLEVRVVDPSHVAMIQMNIDAAAFDTWELDETPWMERHLRWAKLELMGKFSETLCWPV